MYSVMETATVAFTGRPSRRNIVRFSFREVTTPVNEKLPQLNSTIGGVPMVPSIFFTGSISSWS